MIKNRIFAIALAMVLMISIFATVSAYAAVADETTDGYVETTAEDVTEPDADVTEPDADATEPEDVTTPDATDADVTENATTYLQPAQRRALCHICRKMYSERDPDAFSFTKKAFQ